MSMSEIEALELIAGHLSEIKASLVNIGLVLWLMLLFKNMGGRWR